LLAENNHYRDLIILSRPFIESLVNVGFICAKGDEAILKSKKYALQKGYRDLFKGIKIKDFEIKSGLTNYQTVLETSSPQNIKDALAEFTTAKGKEITSWTSETVKQKLEVIGEKFGLGVTGFLTFAFFNIYRDVSEIIHGSYYGVRLYLGIQNRDINSFKSIDEAANYFTNHQTQLATLILQNVSFAIVATIDILEQHFVGNIELKRIKLNTKSIVDKYVARVSMQNSS
jgi:hypothetical protein